MMNIQQNTSQNLSQFQNYKPADYGENTTPEENAFRSCLSALTEEALSPENAISDTGASFGIPTNSAMESLQAQLSSLISGYDQDAYLAVQEKEKEAKDWEELMETVDKHIALAKDGVEEDSQEKLEDWVEAEQKKRELLWNM